METTGKVLFGGTQERKMYNNDNRPSKVELEEMKIKLLNELNRLLADKNNN